MSVPRRRLWLGFVAAASLAGATCTGRCGSPPAPTSPPDQPVASPVAAPLTPRQFVDGIYPHGIPYDKAIALGQAADKELITMLDDPSMRENRGNILITLGMLGTRDGANAIRQVLQSGQGALSVADVTARLDATMALGYVVNAGQVPETLQYLIDGTNRSSWETRIKWRLPKGDDPSIQLRRQCITALGLSGSDDAYTALKNLLPANPAADQRSEAAQINQALTTNRQVKNLGMSGYYQKVLNIR